MISYASQLLLHVIGGEMFVQETVPVKTLDTGTVPCLTPAISKRVLSEYNQCEPGVNVVPSSG